MAADFRPALRSEHGAVLPTVLVVLFILTVLGMLALSTAGVDVRLAANERDYQRALYAAEAGVAHMRALLKDRMVSSPTSPTSWAFDISGQVSNPGIENTLNDCRYRVHVNDQRDRGGTDHDGIDADGEIYIESEAVTPQGTRARIEYLLKADSYEQKTLADYGTGTIDDSAITDKTLQNMGPL